MIRKLIPHTAVNKFKHLPTAVLHQTLAGFPSRNLKVIGVTGTDGKTTTVSMIYHILHSAGKKVAMISTVEARIGDKSYDSGFHVTTPNSKELVKYLKMIKELGIEYLVLEVSSQALVQYRVWGINFDVGVITNITSEHLDYHQTWENYFQAKANLIQKTRIAVLNRDEKHFSRLKKMTQGEVVTFGKSNQADFNPLRFKVSLKVPGEFNLLNAEAAVATTINLGISAEQIKKALASFVPVKGRMNLVENDLGKNIIIDYAHTPNGLENALKAIKTIYKNSKIVAVVGAEGERDLTKREPIGRISARLADFVIITAVDPRGELDQISSQILEGAKKEGSVLGKNVFVENDRQLAIKKAIKELAKAGDTIGIFGKGHENSMNMDGKKELPWSDFDAVQKVIVNGS